MHRPLPLTTLFCLSLAACGGGGDDGGNARPPVSASFAISAANAQAATAASWHAARDSAGYADLAGASGVVATKPGVQGKPATGTPSSRSLVSLLQKIPLGPETLPCQVAGTITISGSLESPTTLSAGDEINVSADACDDGLGEVLDGDMAMTVNALTGDFLAGAYDLTMTLVLTNLQVATATDVETSNGDVTVNLNTLAAPFVAAGVSGNAMTADNNTASITLVDYESTQTVDAGFSPSPYTMTSFGTLDSSELPGAITYSTPVTFAGFDSEYPHTGELLVRGEKSSARLVALDEVNVRIEIDVDDDGVVDSSIETTWEAFAN
jgi:hypothetical protein